jgi:phosphatidylserine synthase
MLPLLVVLLPALGLLMVSRVRYAHVFAALTSGRNTFITLVWIVFAGFLLLLAPKPVLFLAFVGYVAWGAVQSLPVFARRRAEQEARRSGAAS